MRISPKYRRGGFTLVEISIAMVVLTIVGGIAYSVLMNSTTLLAKNVSLNSSNIIVRSALDRIYSEINQAYCFPTTNPAIPKPPGLLINADGTPAPSSEPAAGIIFDRYVGGPYIVGNPGTGLPATTTSFNLYYSWDPLANPPVPVANDVVIMDGSTRALVAASPAPVASTTLTGPVPVPAPTPGKMVTVTLQNTLGTYTIPAGTGISWSPTSQQTAYVLHRKAFVVVPVSGVSGRAELRMYPNAEIVTNYDDPTKYVVLTREIGTQTRTNSPFETGAGTRYENRPFSIYTSNGASYLSIALRVEDQQFNKRLASQQAKEFNTFLRVDAMLRPRSMP